MTEGRVRSQKPLGKSHNTDILPLGVFSPYAKRKVEAHTEKAVFPVTTSTSPMAWHIYIFFPLRLLPPLWRGKFLSPGVIRLDMDTF